VDAPDGTAFELGLDLDRGIAAAVQDFAAADLDDGTHGRHSLGRPPV